MARGKFRKSTYDSDNLMKAELDVYLTEQNTICISIREMIKSKGWRTSVVLDKYSAKEFCKALKKNIQFLEDNENDY